jgi:hypothetical protein
MRAATPHTRPGRALKHPRPYTTMYDSTHDRCSARHGSPHISRDTACIAHIRAVVGGSSKSLAACEDAALGSAAMRRSAEAADRVGVQCVERPICCRFDSPSLRTRQPYLSPAATTYTVLQLHPVVSLRGSQIDWMYNFPVRGGGASAHARRHPAHATGPGTQAPPWPCLVASCCINQAPPRK